MGIYEEFGLEPVINAVGWVTRLGGHVMDEAEQCPELLMMRDGALLHHGTKAALLQRTGTKSVEAAFLALAGGSP